MEAALAAASWAFQFHCDDASRFWFLVLVFWFFYFLLAVQGVREYEGRKGGVVVRCDV